MNFEETMEFIQRKGRFAVKSGLDNIRTLLQYMGNPQDRLQFVHVAGTNGKGSTVAFISHVLMEAGYETGRFTSPYLERFTERIKVNDAEISKEDLCRIASYVKECTETMEKEGHACPTQFELITAIGFQYFYEQHCDIVVLEVGLGGRLDATNIILPPLVAVITTIDYDHMAYLGNTLVEIAGEKAGIIKSGSHVVLYPQVDDVEKVFAVKCAAMDATLLKVQKKSLQVVASSLISQIFHYKNDHDLQIHLPGRFQILNAATAIEAIGVLRQKGWNITRDHLYLGLANTRWAGRMEILQHKPLVMIDGAHNPQGATALAQMVVEHFQNRTKRLIFGMLEDKEVESVTNIIASFADVVYLVEPEDPRAMKGEELERFFQHKLCVTRVIKDVKDSIAIVLREAQEDDVIIACGSLYLIGQLRRMSDLQGRKHF